MPKDTIYNYRYLPYFSLSVDSGPNFLLVFIINIDWKVELTEWQLLTNT